VAIWYAGSLSIVIYFTLLTFYLLRRRRQCYDIPEGEYRVFIKI
jgi:dolichyl-phosphate-mannose-protein mannosyltransferase